LRWEETTGFYPCAARMRLPMQRSLAGRARWRHRARVPQLSSVSRARPRRCSRPRRRACPLAALACAGCARMPATLVRAGRARVRWLCSRAGNARLRWPHSPAPQHFHRRARVPAACLLCFLFGRENQMREVAEKIENEMRERIR